MTETVHPIRTFREFWRFYVGEHRHPRCRALHYLAASMAISCVALAIATRSAWWLVWAPVASYGLAWIGHFFVERNRPATFRYLRWSFVAEFKMFGLFLTGRMGREVERLYGHRHPAADAPCLEGEEPC